MRCIMTMDDAIKAVEDAGWFWAVERCNDDYSAVVARKNYYLGDALAGPGCASGATPAEALMKALADETDNEIKQS